MTPRRARRAHNPTAAFWWGTAKWCALIGASTALGVALALVAAEAIFHGRWAVTGEAASVAFVGVFLGALGAVAHALMVHAIDGPPSLAPDVFDPTGTVFDPNLNHRAEQVATIEAAGRAQAWCPTCESTDRAVLLDQGDGLPCGDPMGWHSPDAAEPVPVPDDVRADARQHADEDDPFGVIGGAP